MKSYESWIDPARFGPIAGHLRRPHSPIHYLLYVREPGQLAPLARHLTARLAGQPFTPEQLTAALAQPLRADTLRVSARQPLPWPDPKGVIDPDTIPPETYCSVLYLPPCYLVHTGGLFAGCLMPPVPRPAGADAAPSPAPAHRIESTRLGELRSELECPFSDYLYVLHVRDRARLTALAAELQPVAVPGGVPRAHLPDLLAGPLQDGAIRVSAYAPVPLADRRQALALGSLPRLARCEVIALPPFFLAHTPGLFERTAVRESTGRAHPDPAPSLRPRGLKL